jgi:nitrate reductase gamma subunit
MTDVFLLRQKATAHGTAILLTRRIRNEEIRSKSDLTDTWCGRPMQTILAPGRSIVI